MKHINNPTWKHFKGRLNIDHKRKKPLPKVSRAAEIDTNGGRERHIKKRQKYGPVGKTYGNISKELYNIDRTKGGRQMRHVI